MDIANFVNSAESLALPLMNETNLSHYGVLQVREIQRIDFIVYYAWF